MKRPGIPAVPPLSETAAARIERGVFAELDRPLPAIGSARRRRRWWWWVVVTAPVAVAAVTLLVGGGWWRAGDDAVRGAHIATAAAGTHVTMEGAAVDVAPHSEIRFGVPEQEGVAIVLERGAVTCDVAPRGRRAPFVVQAGETRVTVVGTRFRVQRIGGHASVHVDHGTVQVGDEGMTQLLHTGDRYEPGDGGGRRAGTVTTREATAQVAVEAPPEATPPPPSLAPISPQAAPVVASPSRPAPRAAVEAAVGNHRRVVASRDSSLRAPLPDETAPAVAPPSEVPAPAEAAPRPPELAVERVPATAEPAPAEPARREPTEQELAQRFEAAARREALNPVEAMRLYAEIAAGDGAWAANALFAQGRLEAEQGHQGPARALLTAYLRRFPQGPNADDARLLLKGLP